MKKNKLNIGDVFEINIDENYCALGQIISLVSKESFSIIVFEKKHSKPFIVPLDQIINDKILLIGHTFDAKFYHNDWKVLGNIMNNLDMIKLPNYLIGSAPNIYVEDFNGNKIRKATHRDLEQLDYRCFVSPIDFELAFKAYYKMEKWEEGFKDILYDTPGSP